MKDDEDKTITAGALVTAVVKLKRSPMLDFKSSSKNVAKQDSKLQNDDRDENSGLEEDDDEVCEFVSYHLKPKLSIFFKNNHLCSTCANESNFLENR